MLMYLRVIDIKNIKLEQSKVLQMLINNSSNYHSNTLKTESMYRPLRTI